MNKKKIFLILTIFGLILTFFGGSLAWLQWRTTPEQETEVVFTVEETFSCSADGGGNITASTLMPTASCTNSNYAIQRTIKVNPTLNSDKSNLTMDLWLDINDIGTGLSNSENFRYALTTTANDCTQGVVNYGKFTDKSDGDKIQLLDQKMYTTTMTDTYYLYIWIDSDETSHDIVGQTIDLSLNGNCTSASKGEPFYAVYSADDTSLRFYKEEDGVIIAGQPYEGRTATNVYKAYENDVYTYNSSTTSSTSPWNEIRDNVTKVVVEDEIKPHSTANWFNYFTNVTNIDLTKLNVSNTVNMYRMFDHLGNEVSTVEMIGLDDWNTSKVTNMSYMFVGDGMWGSTTTWNIGDISDWNVSNVIDMSGMFNGAGGQSSTFNIGDISNWNVSNVTNMYSMFQNAGFMATTWNIGSLSSWNVSNVTNMDSMFSNAGYRATTWDIGNLSNWNVSNVTSMKYMFAYSGYSATTWNIGNLSNWNVSNVTNMQDMFAYSGYSVTNWNIGDISNWNVSNVTNMYSMFYSAGYNTTTWDIGNLSNWDTSKVTNMSGMFAWNAVNATTWNIGDISNWNVSNVTNMQDMFNRAGYSATYSLDLSGWNVNKVTKHNSFNETVESKITAPTWVN